MSEELKDILKPPFYDAGMGLICDGNTRLLDVPGFVSPEQDKNDRHLAHIRGWGFFGYLKNGEEIQDNFAKFVVDALNEKYERDFHTEEPLDKLHPHIHCPQCQYPIYKSDFDTDENGEPLRWIKTRSLGIDWIDCPKCKHGLQEGTKDLNYCPFCGQSLLPPEGDVL